MTGLFWIGGLFFIAKHEHAGPFVSGSFDERMSTSLFQRSLMRSMRYKGSQFSRPIQRGDTHVPENSLKSVCIFKKKSGIITVKIMAKNAEVDCNEMITAMEYHKVTF